MKRFIIIMIALAIVGLTLLLPSPSKAQPHGARPDTVKVKKDTAAKYDYFVLIPAKDYKGIDQALKAYGRLLMYDPNISAADKVDAFKNVDGYLFGLPARLKVDSVRQGGTKKSVLPINK